MPATATPSNTRVAIKVPDEVAAIYEAEAVRRGKTVEYVMSERLSKCRDHNASQAIYFNDDERQALVHLTGGSLINDAAQALARIRTTLSLTIGDVKIDVDQRLAQRICTRAKMCLKSVREACGMF